MRRLAACCLLLGIVLVDARSATAGGPAREPGVEVVPVPDEVVRECHRAQAQASFEVLCPTRLPRAYVGHPRRPPEPLTATVLRDRRTVVGIEAGYGAPYPDDARRNHPGRFLHLALLSGDAEVASAPEGSAPLGTKTWGGRTGELVQAPPYSSSRWGSYHGDHVLFSWRERGSGYTISLHSWRRSEAVPLLEAVIDGLRPASALPPAPLPDPVRGLSRVRIGDPSGLAVDDGAIWVSEYYEGVHRIDVENGTVVGRPVRVSRFPSVLAADEEAVWVGGATTSLDRIDVGGERVAATVPLGAPPSAIAIGETYVWAASYDDGSLTRIDPGTNRPVGGAIRVGGGPSGLASSHGSMWVTDFDRGRIVRVDESTGGVVAELSAGRGLSGIAGTPGAVWAADWERDEVVRIDPSSNRVVARIPVGPAPAGIAVQGSFVWVGDYWDGTLRRIDPATNEVVDRVAGMGHPTQIATDGDRLVVLDTGSGSVVSIPMPEPPERAVEERRRGPVALAVAVAVGAFGVWCIGRYRRRASRA